MQQQNSWQVVGQKCLDFKKSTHQLMKVVSGQADLTKLKTEPWAVLVLLYQMVEKLMLAKKSFIDKNGQKQLRDKTGVSISKMITDSGLDLDQVVFIENGAEFTRRDLILHPIFEKQLIAGVKANFKLALQKWNVPEWKSIYVRRHEGDKPDLVVELRFNPHFNSQLVGYLPTSFKKNNSKKKVEKKEEVKEDFPPLPSVSKKVDSLLSEPVEIQEPGKVSWTSQGLEIQKKENPFSFGDFEPLPEGASWADY